MITKKEAYELLIQGLEDPENIRYVTHCKYVGDLASMIAAELGLDPEYAGSLGYLHDIGRKIEPENHAYAGYEYLMNNGYEEYAYICLTHSFLDNDIECVCGRLLPETNRGYAFVKDFVEKHENTDYDRIIQTCDLLCLHSGGTTLEERIADIEERKGTHKKSAYHRKTAFAQKEAIEKRLGHSIYDFYKYLGKGEEKMKKILVVVDMQKDFVDGALGTKEAVAILPAVCEKIKGFDGKIFATFDTHFDNYMDTAEGKNLPVPHCIKGTDGWQLDKTVAEALKDKNCTPVEKVTFGSVDLPRLIKEAAGECGFSVELIGLCTDICVVSNALIIKANFPEAQISVDPACCAGVTPEKHKAALETMRSCQINVI